MRTVMKKTVCILLCALMTVSAFCGLGFGAGAQDDGEIILHEGFDVFGVIPEGWTENITNTSWTTCGAVTSSDGYRAMSFCGRNNAYWKGARGEEGDLITPALDLSAESSVILDFWYQNARSKRANVESYVVLAVNYRVNGGEWTELFRTDEDHSVWTHAKIVLPADALRENVQIGFRGEDCFGHGVLLDEVHILRRDHRLSFSLSGDTLTATCGNDVCMMADHRAALKLNAPAKSYVGDTQSAAATLSNPDAFRQQIMDDITVGAIEYYSGDVKLDAPPETAGTYTAQVCVAVNGTDYVLTSTYTIYSTAAEVMNDTKVVTVLSENFDSLSLSSVPAGWENVDLEDGASGSLRAWSVVKSYSSTYGVNNRTNFLFHDEKGQHQIILPAQDLRVYKSASLSFRYMNPTGDGSAFNALTVHFRVDGGAWTELFYSAEAQDAWAQCTLDLPADVLRENVEFAFSQGFDDDLNDPRHENYGAAIDDVLLKCGQACTHCFSIPPLQYNVTTGGYGNCLTATCTNDVCTIDGKKLTLTLNAPEKKYEAHEASALPTISGLELFAAHGLDVTVGAFEYQDAGHAGMLDAAPETTGRYRVVLPVTINGTTYRLEQLYQINRFAAVDVIFDAGGGSGTMESLYGYESDSVTLPQNTFTPPSADMMFAGWSDGSSVYPENYTYTLLSDVTFTAQWAQFATVTFDSNGGSAIAPQRVIKNRKASDPGLPMREGYFTKCWLLDGAPYNFARPVTEDITLTVEWTDYYRLAYDFEDGSMVNLVNSYAYNASKWKQIATDAQTPVRAHSGDHCAATEFYPGNDIAVLNLGTYDLSGVSKVSLSFWYCNPANPETGKCDYILSAQSGSQGKPHDTWQQCTINYASSTLGKKSVQFQIWAIREGGSGVYLDDIVLTIGDHDISYSLEGGVLTATCAKELCSLDDHAAALTLRAPEKKYVTDNKSPLATVGGAEAFSAQTGAAVTVGEIAYYAGGTKLDAAPTALGAYTAKATVTVDGTEYELTRDYAICNVPHDQQSVTIDDQISVNFLLDLDARPDVQSVTIAYIDPTTGAVTDTAEYTDFSGLDRQGGLYKIPADVAPAQIGDTIRATIVYAADSTDTLSTSVAGYCKQLLQGDFDKSVKDLAAATLEYGQAANDYFAGAGFCEPVEIGSTTAAAAAVDAVKTLESTLLVDAGGKIVSASFMALTKPEFRFYTAGLTEAEAAALNDKITVTGGAAAQFVKNADSGEILLEVTGIDAENMDEIITVSIDGFGSVTFSGNDFARILANNASTAVLGAALYNYGAAAKACFA